MSEMALAECGIRQLHARYIDATWRKDVTAFADCFAEDGEWQLAGLHLRGRADIAATFTRLLGMSQRVLMVTGTPVLEFGQGSATGRVHMTEFIKRENESLRTLGVYYDRYVGEGLHWRFRSRYLELFYRGVADFSAPLLETTDHGPFPAMPET